MTAKYEYFREENIVPLPIALKRRSEQHPERIAIQPEFGSPFTYKDLLSWSELFGEIIGEFAHPGERVALWLPNVPQFIFAYYGTLLAQTINVPINYLTIGKELRTQPTETIIPTDEIRAQFADSEPSVIFVWDLFWPILEKIGGPLTEKSTIVIVGPNDILPIPLNLIPNKVLYKIPEIVAKVSRLQKRGTHAPAENFPKSRIEIPSGRKNVFLLRDLVLRKKIKKMFGEPKKRFNLFDALDNVAQLQYTGGTTGTPKGAMLTHRNLISNVWQCREHLKDVIEEGATVLGALPFFHIFGLNICLNETFIGFGGKLVLLSRFSPYSAVKTIKNHNVSILPAAVPMLAGIAAMQNLAVKDLKTLKMIISGASHLGEEVKSFFENTVGVPCVVQGYGLSETSPVVATTKPGANKAGYVGTPLPGTELKFLKPGTNEETANEGEICVKGPQVMRGYYRNFQETANVFDGGWLRTGDGGSMDENGLRITDRIKNMGKINGENVYGAPIENFVMRCPAVKTCAVIFTPPQKNGNEYPVLFAALRETRDEQELRNYLKTTPNRLWRISEIFIMDEPTFDRWTNVLGKVNHEKVKKFYRENKNLQKF